MTEVAERNMILTVSPKGEHSAQAVGQGFIPGMDFICSVQKDISS